MKKVLFVLFGLGLLTGCSNVLDNKSNDFCPDCVFGKEKTKIGEKIPSSYSSDYSKLGNYFLGHIVEDGIVKKSYVCGIEKEVPFCLESISYLYDYTDQSYNISDYNLYIEKSNEISKMNTSKVKEIFPNCDFSGEVIFCYGTDVGIYSVKYNEGIDDDGFIIGDTKHITSNDCETREGISECSGK